MVGKSIAHYKITEKIGQGGMGEVYLAQDTTLDRQVALKCLPDEMQADETARKRFLREAKSAAALDHPFICKIFEIGEADGRAFISMEYVEGRTLRDKLVQGPLPVKQALQVASEIAEALEKAHRSDIVHRDLKPANVMLTPEGHVKVMDFGLAKRMASEKEGSAEVTLTGLTKEGSTIGTVPYMSPEQLKGESVDTRSDIFSFGVLLYEMLAGMHPFKKPDVMETAGAILNHEPPPLARYREEVSEVLQHTVRKMLGKDLDQRYQSIHEVRTNLEELKEAVTGVSAVNAVTEPSQPAPKSSRMKLGAGSLGAIALVAVLYFSVLYQSESDVPESVPVSTAERKSVAVLPFDNLSADPENEYFSDGVTEEIMSQLAKIRDLKVISRTSIMQYKDTDKNLRQIGAELGVSTILEGSVRRDNERVRITAQLIDTTTDEHLWADSYDHQLADIFAVQSDVALQIAHALEANLTAGEKEDIEERPTESIEAHDYYLRAISYEQRSQLEESDLLTIQMLEEAIKLDPNFALAYAALSEVHSHMYWEFYDRTQERIARAKAAVDQAFKLEPDLPEAHRALGYYHYWCHLDYDRALEELAVAQAGRPNDSRVSAAIGYVRRRQGRLEEAAANQRRASELDPRSAESFGNLAETYLLMRRWDEAEKHLGHTISLSPEYLSAYGHKALLYLVSEGNVEKARAVLKTARALGLEGHARTAYIAVSTEIYGGNYEEALRLSASRQAFDHQFFYIPKELVEASVYGLLSQSQSEQARYDAARKILEAKIQENPEDSRFHSSLGIACAGLGRKEDAIREGKLGTGLMPVSKEAWKGSYRVEDLARIYVMVGESDAAIEQLDLLLSIPSRITVPLLQIDPVWRPLLDQPKFKELVERYSQ